ncbi:MAG: S1-like domain-containing RNA-binding protein [Clostridiales bacterium]|nr:S1-like domain-containing RNA-binding protein [Clostridiales bacterium]
MKLGEKQTLTVVKTVDFGVYLAEHPDDKDKVLLPVKQVPAGTAPGDSLEVFLYRDSSDRLIATTREPRLTIGSVALLKVAQVTRIGAFLDWGLEKDLFLPYKEQLRAVREGDEILVTLYIDKSSRLCATMKGLYHLLRTDSPYQKGDTVTGRVYEFSKNFGTFVAVDDCYSAMIPGFENTSGLKIGNMVSATVTNVKADGKLDLTIREKAYIQMDADAQEVLQLITEYGGVLPFNDKASPEIIKREAHMSKNAFKRAVGHLYKERQIEFTERGIRLTGKVSD